METTSVLQFIFVVFALGLWFLFPLVLFIAMNSSDRYGEKLYSIGRPVKVPSEMSTLKERKFSLGRFHWPRSLRRIRHDQSKNMARP